MHATPLFYKSVSSHLMGFASQESRSARAAASDKVRKGLAGSDFFGSSTSSVSRCQKSKSAARSFPVKLPRLGATATTKLTLDKDYLSI